MKHMNIIHEFKKNNSTYRLSQILKIKTLLKGPLFQFPNFLTLKWALQVKIKGQFLLPLGSALIFFRIFYFKKQKLLIVLFHVYSEKAEK